PSPLAVLQGEQYLGDRDVPALQQLLVGMGETDLADGRRRLALFQPQRTLRETQLAAPERDRPRGNQDDLLAALPEAQEVLDQALEPGPVDASCLRVRQERGTDLHHDASCPGKRRGR